MCACAPISSSSCSDRAIAELIDMDNAVAIAQAYARQHKDTLVIVTSDHAQGYGEWRAHTPVTAVADMSLRGQGGNPSAI